MVLLLQKNLCQMFFVECSIINTGGFHGILEIDSSGLWKANFLPVYSLKFTGNWLALVLFAKWLFEIWLLG